jgi:UDP-N-acetylmuramoyl-tripeptide--D-alanyl-D-alanine ligase
VRLKLPVAGGAITVIDESYNANPASMRAALALLGRTEPGKGGRRIAVLGDMLELGRAAPELHAGLGPAVEAARADHIYACGEYMAYLWDALPPARRGAYAKTSAELKEPLLSALRRGDVAMIKGSLGSRMAPLVEAIKERYGKG